MSLRNLDIAEWKLSAAIALTRAVADEGDYYLLSSDELRGLYQILKEVKELVFSPSDVLRGVGASLEKEIPQ